MIGGPALSRGLSPLRQVLNNGVVILAEATDAVPAVALNATFTHGSVEDPEDLPGVAYLTRKVIDRGTTSRSAGDIARTLDDRGVSLRTSVTRHSFSLSCVCLPEDFHEILALIGDVARHPGFLAEELERRRVEAITSLHEDEDDPSKLAVDLLHESLYGSQHPYGRLIKGTRGTLETITRAHLLQYQERWLVPSALRVAVAGAIPTSAVLSSAARVFEDWAAPRAIDAAIPPPPARSARTVTVKRMDGKSQADIAYGFSTVRRLDPRFYAYWIMNTVLGQFGLGGRLAENIRERQGMAYYAYSTLEATVGEGPLIIRAGVDPVNVDRAVAAIDAEVRSLRDSGPTTAELEETRESLIGSIPRMLETNESTAEFLLHAEQFGLGLDYDRRLPDLLQRVTMQDVREAAAEVLDPSRAAVAIAGPVA